VAFPTHLSVKARAHIAALSYGEQQAAYAYIDRISADPIGMTDGYTQGARMSNGMQLVPGSTACYVQVVYSFVPTNPVVVILGVPFVKSGGAN
jgi:hypothetical protein